MGSRVRTEPSPEFTEQSGGRTKVSPEFQGESGGRTRPSEDFTRDGGGLPVERYAPAAGGPMASQAGRPDPQAWAREKMREAEQQEFTPLGQISQVLLLDRDIDFGKAGPLLGFTQRKELLISTPVFSLPPRRVLVDRKGKPIWNVEKLTEGQRARVLAGSRIEEQRMNLTAYAETGRYHGFYVISPLTQILFTTADLSRRLIFVNFYPGSNGNYPVLLFDPQSSRLTIWGGGGYTFA